MSGYATHSGRAPIAAVLSLASIIVAFIAMFTLRPPHQIAVGFAPSHARTEASDIAFFECNVASDSLTKFVHSAAAADIGGGRIRAMWNAGTRESHADIALHTSLFDPQTRSWSPERSAITLDWVRSHLNRNIISLGNPVLMQHEDGRLLLWFVSVSVGGWSGSAINMTTSRDGGESWEPPVRLVTSPFFNVATLVRQPPFMFADGTIGLPVYHESFGIFAELLRLDSQGRVLHKQRLSWGRSTLQPKIVPRNQLHAIGFLRRSGSAPRRVLSIESDDGGRTWSAHRVLELPNPGAPVAATWLQSGELKLVFNNTSKHRINLTIARSPNAGDTWQIVRTIDGHEEEGAVDDASYPALVQTPSGEFHVLYTADHNHIRHVHFNTAWLEQMR